VTPRPSSLSGSRMSGPLPLLLTPQHLTDALPTDAELLGQLLQTGSRGSASQNGAIAIDLRQR
jgi:hypothetical protein